VPVAITLRTVRLHGGVVQPGAIIRVADEQVLIDRGYARRLSEEESKAVVQSYVAEAMSILVEENSRTELCRSCRTANWWLSKWGVLVCRVCHPPASQDLIRLSLNNNRSEGNEVGPLT
jgi:hypothetical protein